MTVLRKENNTLNINNRLKFQEIGIIFTLVSTLVIRKKDAWMDKWLIHSKRLNSIWKTRAFKQTNKK